MRKFIEKIIFESRWILSLFYAGLFVALLALAVYFIADLAHVFMSIVSSVFLGQPLAHEDMIISILGIVELVMIANLINIIKTGSFSIFINPLTEKGSSIPAWLTHIDPGALKVKMSMALVNIAGVYLLSDFIHSDELNIWSISTRAGLYIIFVVGAFLMAKTDHILNPNHSKD